MPCLLIVLTLSTLLCKNLKRLALHHQLPGWPTIREIDRRIAIMLWQNDVSHSNVAQRLLLIAYTSISPSQLIERLTSEQRRNVRMLADPHRFLVDAHYFRRLMRIIHACQMNQGKNEQ